MMKAPITTLTPYGIFLPEYKELYLFFVGSKLTADCIVDLRLAVVVTGIRPLWPHSQIGN